MSTSNEMCGGFFVHTMKHCYVTALYTIEVSAIRYTCAYNFTARVKSRAYIVYGRNAENEPYKNGRLPCVRKYGSAIAIFETKPLYEKRQIYSGASTILSP